MSERLKQAEAITQLARNAAQQAREARCSEPVSSSALTTVLACCERVQQYGNELFELHVQAKAAGHDETAEMIRRLREEVRDLYMQVRALIPATGSALRVPEAPAGSEGKETTL